MLSDLRFCIGPMNKYIIDAVFEFCEENACANKFALLPSRRQIDYRDSYVGEPWTCRKYTTEEFVGIVGNDVVIQRDHAGPGQGTEHDHGLVSLSHDITAGIRLIHIDPWKQTPDWDFAADKTVSLIKFCEQIVEEEVPCSEVRYEIGTEEGICPYTTAQLDGFVKIVRRDLGSELFSKVLYVVVQSGTRVAATRNIGEFDVTRCREMTDLCHAIGKLAKEHNSDYLTLEQFQERRQAGVDCFNIAPEFGMLTTGALIETLEKNGLQNIVAEFERICAVSNKWQKWFTRCSPTLRDIVMASGHYQFAMYECSACVFTPMQDAGCYDQFVENAKLAVKKKLAMLLGMPW